MESIKNQTILHKKAHGFSLNKEFLISAIFMLELLNGFVAEILKFFDLSAPTALVWAAIYLLSFLLWIKTFVKKTDYVFLVLLLFSTLILGTCLFYPENQKIIFNFGSFGLSEIAQSNIVIMLGCCLPIFVACKTGINNERLNKYLVVFSRTVVSLFILTMFLSIFIYSDDINYMSIAYSALPPLLFVTYNRYQNKLKLDFVLLLFGIVGLIFGGSRGALLTFLVFVILYELMNFKKRSTSQKLLIVLLIPICIVFLFVNFTSIITFLDNWLKSFGYSGRLFAKILGSSMDGDILHFSDRQEILDLILPQIELFGKGLFGDRVIANVYAHNIFIEVLCHFGYFFGSIIIISFVVWMFNRYVIFKKTKCSFGVFAILSLTVIVFVKLMFSASYLTDRAFWLFLGLSSAKLMVKEEKGGES